MDSITIRTSIKPKLKRFLLIRGSLLALIGVGLLLYSGIFITVDTLSNWGAAIWFISFLFIAWGLVPYRRITKIEENPNQIVVTEDEMIHYHRHGKDILSFPLAAIEEIHFVRDMGLYGIALTLKEETQSQVPNPAISVVGQMFLWTMRRRHKFDRFFPFFSERGTKQLQELLRS